MRTTDNDKASPAAPPTAFCPRTDHSPTCPLDKRLIGAGSPQSIEILKPVTNQVTTAPGDDRRSATYSDTRIAPTCGKPTQCDGL